MSLKFRHIEPLAPLKDYIEKMWLFQSDGRMPIEDMKLVVPNGNLKLTISYQNGVVASIRGKNFFSREHQITLTGLIDVPVILDTEKDLHTETIGIEFKPQGVHRLFRFRLHEIANQICPLDELIGKTGHELADQIANAGSVREKLLTVQYFLIKQLSFSNDDMIFKYCVEEIVSSGGKTTIKELEKKTGYSSRWLNSKFKDKLGASPKNLSSIIRFNNYYQSFISGSEQSGFRNDFYHSYYDQSHLIKDFKRFTGLPPSRLEKQVNDFGKSYLGK